VIVQDVHRLFPEVDFFRQAAAQEPLSDALHIFTKVTGLPYRQGMHELMGLIYFVVYQDSLVVNDSSSAFQTALDRRFVEHDTYALFMALMERMKDYFTTADSSPPVQKVHQAAVTTEQDRPFAPPAADVCTIFLYNLMPCRMHRHFPSS
jgi:hypothetical protein